MALNSRTLASLRAKSQLLEVSESSVAQLRSDLAELTATTTAKERALQLALDEARTSNDKLQCALSAANLEATQARSAASEARRAVETQRDDSHALSEKLSDALAAKSRVEEETAAVRTEALEAIAERKALRAALQEERGGATLERLARLLAYAPRPIDAHAEAREERPTDGG